MPDRSSRSHRCAPGPLALSVKPTQNLVYQHSLFVNHTSDNCLPPAYWPARPYGKLSSMLLSLLLAYLAGAAPASALTGRSLERRGAQTAAVCSTDFTWADNSKGVSPCLLAAVVLGACQGGNWNVPALVNQNDKYTNPNSSTANVCTCSWLAYNLLSACSDCQGVPQAVQNVAPYFESCQGFTTTTNSYFPNNYSLPEGTLIPYWATYDPSTWPSQHFDATTAKSIAQQEHPDISNSPTISSSKKKTPIGAIVGGVVGGVAVIVLAVGIGLFMCRRRTPKQQPVSLPLTMGQSAHFRSPSDMTMVSNGSMGYTTLSSSPAHPVERSGTVRTHNTSANSLPFFSSPVTTIPRTLPTARQTSPTPSNPEDIIVPFHIPPGGPINPPLGDRKNPDGSYPVYDAPTAPPISIQSRTEPSTGSSRRARINPPAYSATDSPSPPPRAQRGLLRQGSTDTHQTYASGTQNDGGHTNEGSISGITSSDVRIPETSAAASGRVVGGPSRDAKRRPTVDNDNVSSVDPRDIA